MADLTVIAEELGLKVDQLELANGNFYAVVHEKWLAHVLSKQVLPAATDCLWPDWSGENNVAHGDISKPWLRLNIQVIRAGPDTCLRVPALHPNAFQSDQNVFQFLGAIASKNYRQQWKEAYRKGNPLQNQLTAGSETKYQDIPLRDILRKLYGCPFIGEGAPDVSGSPAQPQTGPSCLVPILCCITRQSAVYLLQSVTSYTLQQCVTFSPAMLASSYAKPLYIIYQLLQIVDTFHQRGLTCGNIALCDFTLQEDLWVHFIGPRWSQLFPNTDILPGDENESNRNSTDDDAVSYKELLKEVQLVDLKSTSVKSLPEITRMWVLGKISNFEYLMILNYLTGRRVNDPDYHPIVPWVCDFSSEEGGLRDLSKSQYRLNKGDQHLGMMYEALHTGGPTLDGTLGPARHVPHHITAMLSDITYYVYKARQTSQSVLCDHVRRKWVPEEYPSSMQRMQEWTPDECIPEFFCDPQIFRSIHSDLPDLEIPLWCEDEESFVNWHRSILESEPVSERLHRWIDITFGYKLSGGAAKKSMNVFLHLMDEHTTPTGHGVIQLFHSPHPRKLSPSPYLGADAPSITRNQLKAPAEGTVRSGGSVHEGGPEVPDITLADGMLDGSAPPDQSMFNQNEMIEATQAIEISSESMDNMAERVEVPNRQSAGVEGIVNTSMHPSAIEENQGSKNPIKKLPFFRVKIDSAGKVEPRPEDALVKLPDDYDPLAALSQVEALYSFSSKSLHGIPEPAKQEVCEDDFDRSVEKDLLALGCTIAELFLSNKIRSQHPTLPLKERKRVILRTLRTDWLDIPRPCRDIIQLLLKIEVESSTLCRPVQPFGASFLLSPHSEVIPFPQFIPSLYQLAKELSETDSSINRHQFLCSLDPSVTTMIESLKRRKVHIARRVMPEVLAHTNEEGKDILLLYLLDLFRNPDTGLFALLMLFNKLAQYLGPKKTTEHCLPIIKATYEMRHTTSHFILLYHRPFLTQLTVRLGCRAFLRHIVQYIIMAINRLKDCPLHSSEDDPWVQGSSHRNSEVDFVSFTQDGNKKDMIYGGGVFNITGLEEQDKGCVDGQSSDEEESGASEEENTDSSSAIKVASAVDDSLSDDSRSLDADVVSLDSERRLSDKDIESSATGSSLSKSSDSRSLDDKKSLESIVDDKDGRPLDDECGPLDTLEQPLDVENRSLESDRQHIQTRSRSVDARRRSLEDGYHCSDEELPTFVVSGNDSKVKKGNSLDAGDNGSPRSLGEFAMRPGASSSTPEARVSNSTPEPVQSSPFVHTISSDLPVNISLSEVCSRSAVWLAERLGPALTSRYIVTNLFEALIQCYTGPHLLDHPLDDFQDNRDFSLVGDTNAEPVLACLMDICGIYGDQIILRQCLPFIQENIPKKKTKVLMKHETAMVASMVLLVRVLQHIPENHLQERTRLITKKILYPVINLMSSLNHVFPSGSGARNSLCRKLVEVITTLALRIGRERGRSSLKELLHDFFLRFDVISGVTSVASLDRKLSNLSTDSDDYYCEIKKDSLTDQYRVGTPTRIDDLKGDSHDLRSPPIHSPLLSGIIEGSDNAEYKQEALLQLESVFTPEMAYIAYVPLCRLIGNIHMENTISNHELIWRLYSTHEAVLSSKPNHRNKEKTKELEIPSSVAIGQTGSTVPDSPAEELVSVPGLESFSRGAISLPTSHNDDLNKSNGAGSITNRHLRGYWKNYWEEFIGHKEDNDSYHLTQIKLQTFSGGVRALQVMPNENSFASASRDKTVKLWSLRNYGDGTANISCQFTYPHHKKTVFALNYLESQRLIASCDGNVYVWDPFGSGAALRGYDLSKNVPTCMIAMPPPNPVLIVSTPDATVQIIDIRQPVVQHELRVSAGPLGLIRCLSVSPDGTTLGVGLSSGVLSLVDLRTGLLLGGWRAHEGEILQVKAHTNRSFVTSSVDSTMALWREDATQICSFRGITEPVSFLCLSNNQIITASPSCRMGIYTSINEQASFSSTKVRSDVFKGVVSALDVLPLNKLFLVGSENGQITLMA